MEYVSNMFSFPVTHCINCLHVYSHIIVKCTTTLKYVIGCELGFINSKNINHIDIKVLYLLNVKKIPTWRVNIKVDVALSLNLHQLARETKPVGLFLLLFLSHHYSKSAFRFSSSVSPVIIIGRTAKPSYHDLAGAMSNRSEERGGSLPS